jgi:hypothetical protein
LKNKAEAETYPQQNSSPADFPLGSLESRARARAMLEAREFPGLWEERAVRKFEQLKLAALAEGPGIDTPGWKALEEFLEDCQTEAPRHGAHTPAYREWQKCFDAYCELSRQVEADGPKADPASVKLVKEYGAFYADCVREWKEEGSLPIDLIPYPERERYIERQKERAEANQGGS